MTAAHDISDRIRTAAFLLTGILQLSFLAGPVVAESVSSRQVDRLLEDLAGDGEIPQELALQCHLISLVTDAVTLQATITATLSASRVGSAISLDRSGSTCGTSVKKMFRPNSSRPVGCAVVENFYLELHDSLDHPTAHLMRACDEMFDPLPAVAARRLDPNDSC